MENPYATPKSELSEEPKQWKRPLILTIWLWFMLVSNVINAPATLLMKDKILEMTPKASEAIIFSLALASLFNIVCVIALFKNKKWGLWGFMMIVIYAFVVNYYMLGLKVALMGLIGFAILLALLHVGGDRKTWSKFS